VPIAAEVDSFQREIGGDQEFSSRRQAQHSTVISDSGGYRPARVTSAASRGSFRQTANLGNQRFFRKRHGAITIPPTDQYGRRFLAIVGSRKGASLANHLS
jgi:hypothetical protein